MDLTKRFLEKGKEYPYHGQPPKDWAEEIVCGILYDLSDRRGINHALDEVSDDIKAEIVRLS